MSEGWLQAAAQLPLAFAQVREDPSIDIAAVERLAKPVDVVMVASGGCTAAALAAAGDVTSIHLVDPNPAQLGLSRLKLRLLAADPALRRALLGHAAMSAGERAARLSDLLTNLDLAADLLGPVDLVAAVGPDHAGRYEHLFLALRHALERHMPALESLLHNSVSPQERRDRCAAGAPLGIALDHALREIMALPNLVALFDEDATRNPVVAFDRHFAARIRHALTALPVHDNPWLWQMLLGRFPDGSAYPWLDVPAPRTYPAVTWECGFMDTALDARCEALDFVHLSNILDWLSPERAAQTLARAFKALRRGGCVLVRQLNSSLDIPSLGAQFRWDDAGASTLHRSDRSFFYRALYWGFKR